MDSSDNTEFQHLQHDNGNITLDVLNIDAVQELFEKHQASFSFKQLKESYVEVIEAFSQEHEKDSLELTLSEKDSENLAKEAVRAGLRLRHTKNKTPVARQFLHDVIENSYDSLSEVDDYLTSLGPLKQKLKKRAEQAAQEQADEEQENKTAMSKVHKVELGGAILAALAGIGLAFGGKKEAEVDQETGEKKQPKTNWVKKALGIGVFGLATYVGYQNIRHGKSFTEALNLQRLSSNNQHIR